MVEALPIAIIAPPPPLATNSLGESHMGANPLVDPVPSDSSPPVMAPVVVKPTKLRPSTVSRLSSAYNAKKYALIESQLAAIDDLLEERLSIGDPSVSALVTSLRVMLDVEISSLNQERTEAEKHVASVLYSK
jgi:hypothetical protein